VFGLLVAVQGKLAWSQIAAGLKDREDKIRRDIADAEAQRKRSEETLRQYNEQLATAEAKIREMMVKAQADAERLATNLRMQAQQESEEIKDRANREIDAARKAALTDIYAQAADISTSIASRILRRNLNTDDQRELVNQSLQQLQTAGNG
jgi:F-type H+-transporting ATPase subunit b